MIVPFGDDVESDRSLFEFDAVAAMVSYSVPQSCHNPHLQSMEILPLYPHATATEDMLEDSWQNLCGMVSTIM